MKFTQAQSLEYKAQVPSFIRRMKGERVESDAEHPSEEQGEEEVDEFGRSRQKRTEHLEREEKEDEDDEIKAMIKDGAQIDNLEILKEKPEKTDATPPPVDSPTQNDSPKKEAAQQGVAFGKASKKRKTLRVDNTSSTPSSSLPSSAPKKKKVKQNKGLLSFE
ncbi:hypothetical protein E3P99_03365 [Wallemia hederae]|uniref:DUF4604 domain-containing protein n=1 Tax=Wallemia hederae TaxID=1540922 RepID=A0A4T0FI19_9BASI|nr:hypothetical protein E3P99_03365 [Wallemia hederae]